MAFQSYCWSLGTTSFRVQNLNYKIEKQLQLLNILWSDKENKIWDYFTQEKYYEIMHKEGFVVGNAPIKDKDARQKTSGLVEIGVIDKDRKITDIGNKIIEIINNEDFEDNNIFNINKDSYIYLKQMLKIIPLSIDEIVKILEKKINYMQLYKMFEEAYNDTKINDLRWYDTLIKEEIKNIYK